MDNDLLKLRYQLRQAREAWSAKCAQVRQLEADLVLARVDMKAYYEAYMKLQMATKRHERQLRRSELRLTLVSGGAT